MSDQRLRGLERRFRESGAVEDEADSLCERVRQGQLRADDLGRVGQFSPAAALALEQLRRPPTRLSAGKRGERGRLARRDKPVEPQPFSLSECLGELSEGDRVLLALAGASLVAKSRRGRSLVEELAATCLAGATLGRELDLREVELDPDAQRCIARAACAAIRSASGASPYEDDGNETVWEDVLDSLAAGAGATKCDTDAFALRAGRVLALWGLGP
ncbi:MAG: hypothetical protein AB7N76_36210 [Planctomycetota bacterium]